MSIHIWTGCMFSGKTSELIRTARYHEVKFKKKVLYVKYTKDNRYSATNIISHNSLWKATAHSVSNLSEVKVDSYDIIAIDEGQFFSDLVEYCEAWAQDGKVVLVSGLVSDFQRNAFQNVLGLIPKAEEIHSLYAVRDKCNGHAYFTFKRLEGNEKQIEIGGKELYIPLCRQCYTKATLDSRHVHNIKMTE